LKYLLPLNESWNLSFQGDVGGLSMGSDLTYSAAVGLAWRINETITLDLKYKGLWVDYEEGNPGNPEYFLYDTVTHGVIVGMIFNL
jgi:opacity protein-like surface antigen